MPDWTKFFEVFDPGGRVAAWHRAAREPRGAQCPSRHSLSARKGAVLWGPSPPPAADAGTAGTWAKGAKRVVADHATAALPDPPRTERSEAGARAAGRTAGRGVARGPAQHRQRAGRDQRH